MATPITDSATGTFAYNVKDLSLADQGKRRAEWAFQSMPALQSIRKHLIKTQPFRDLRIGALIDISAETANLVIALRDGGASISVCSPNPIATQDDIAASLVRDYSVPTFAIQGESDEVHAQHLDAVLGLKPHFLVDHDGELLSRLIAKSPEAMEQTVAGSEATTRGLSRLRALAADGRLPYPVIAVGDSQTKHLFNDRYGAAQSILDGILRATHVLFAGLTVVVAGYGWCGQGVALKLKGLGARVIVTEIDPFKAVKAVMDGHRVMSMSEAASLGDLFITVTGGRNIIGREHFDKFKNGAILCNAGHSSVEIDLEILGQLTLSRRSMRTWVEEFTLRDGRRIHVLAGGQAINFVANEGSPAAVMDLFLAHHALSVEYLLKHHSSLEKVVHPVPYDIDCQVARARLESMGVKIDRLTLEQEQYLASLSEPAQ
ncbi:MAG: adenosylhomocysteinase [Bryobacteraceae bacterium]